MSRQLNETLDTVNFLRKEVQSARQIIDKLSQGHYNELSSIKEHNTQKDKKIKDLTVRLNNASNFGLEEIERLEKTINALSGQREFLKKALKKQGDIQTQLQAEIKFLTEKNKELHESLEYYKS